jgi:hypothetical protein
MFAVVLVFKKNEIPEPCASTVRGFFFYGSKTPVRLFVAIPFLHLLQLYLHQKNGMMKSKNFSAIGKRRQNYDLGCKKFNPWIRRQGDFQ